MSLFTDKVTGLPQGSLLGQLGQSVTYRAGGTGDGVIIVGVLQPESLEFGRSDDGEQSVRKAMLFVSLDPNLDTYGGVASPARKDTVTTDGNEWTVVDVPILDEGTKFAELALELRSRTETSAKDYRWMRE